MGAGNGPKKKLIGCVKGPIKIIKWGPATGLEKAFNRGRQRAYKKNLMGTDNGPKNPI